MTCIQIRSKASVLDTYLDSPLYGFVTVVGGLVAILLLLLSSIQQILMIDKSYVRCKGCVLTHKQFPLQGGLII